MDRILIIGAGGHARACVDVIEKHAGYSIGGLVGLPDEVGKRILGYKVIGTNDDIPSLVSEYRNAMVCVGHIKTVKVRRRLFQELRSCGFQLPAIVSPLAYVSPHAEIGEGTIVMHHAIVNTAASVGRCCIVNSMSLVEHDAKVGDFCHVSTRAVLNGAVRIGSGTFVGSGAVVREGVSLGEDCFIAMGRVVARDSACGTVLRLGEQ